MADEVDIANARQEREREQLLKARKPAGPAPVGYCLNCGPDVPLEGDRRFCDADCRDDFQRRNGK